MTVMLFLAGITSSDAFLLLFGVLPVIWLYCMFDAVQLIHRKQAGEMLVDRTLFEEMEAGREEGRRSKVLATLLSAFMALDRCIWDCKKRAPAHASFLRKYLCHGSIAVNIALFPYPGHLVL